MRRRSTSVDGLVATVARGAAIWAIAILCVLIYTAGSLRRLVIFDREARAVHRARQRGQLLRWSFARLGATFVKIGQVMSTRADLMSPLIIAELRELQDRCAPFAFGRVRAMIERELGAPLADIFVELDEQPLAAGSIAQVHRGVLHSGEEVAVKVLRPDVHARVCRDARLLLWLAHVAYAVSARARAADVIGHTRSLVTGIIAQTDLEREGNNYDEFREQFAEQCGLAFPYVHHRYSTHAVLTMEMIHGVHLERVGPEHVEQVTRTLRETFFAMCFEHGLVHADLHPGNVLVRDDGTVVLLDVGLVKHLDAATIAKVLELARCLALGTAKCLVEHLRQHHPHAPSTNWTAVAADIEAFISELRHTTMAELEASVVVGKLFAIARKHRIRPLPELSLVLLGTVTIEGIAKRLDPRANMLAEVARYLAPLVDRRRFPRGSGPLSPASYGIGVYKEADHVEADVPPSGPGSTGTSRSPRSS